MKRFLEALEWPDWIPESTKDGVSAFSKASPWSPYKVSPGGVFTVFVICQALRFDGKVDADLFTVARFLADEKNTTKYDDLALSVLLHSITLCRL